MVRGDHARQVRRHRVTADESFAYDADPEAAPSQGRWRIHGLDLPDPVLRAVYHDNAARLIRF